MARLDTCPLSAKPYLTPLNPLQRAESVHVAAPANMSQGRGGFAAAKAAPRAHAWPADRSESPKAGGG